MVTKEEIAQNIDSTPPFQQDAVRTAYTDQRVAWELEFTSITVREDGSAEVTCTGPRIFPFPWVSFVIDLDKYPQFKLLRNNDPIKLSAKIKSIGKIEYKLYEITDVEFLDKRTSIKGMPTRNSDDKFRSSASPSTSYTITNSQVHFGLGDIHKAGNVALSSGNRISSLGKTLEFLVAMATILGFLWAIYVYFQPASAILDSADRGQHRSIPPLSIHDIENASVPNFADETSDMVVLANGVHKFETELGLGGYVGVEHSTTSYAYGDFDEDGYGDVAAVISASGGGSGTFYFLSTFLNREGLPQYNAAYYLGDRITMKSVTTSESEVTVDFLTQGPNEPFCCGTIPKTLHLLVNQKSVSEK
ncbi:MAG: hypothetical protein KBD21_00980 [Candidatus Pacebacteria bacterium]|nr:hypothetical protein [Candidatus Paceibacterota bacterium]